MKIIHIATDEKFIDSAINQFTWYENVESLFFVYIPNKKIQFVKSKGENVLFFTGESELVDAVNSTEADVVLLHSLYLSYKELLKIKHRIIWKEWGFDFYCDKYDGFQKLAPLNLFAPQTRKFNTSLKRKTKHYVRQFFAFLGRVNEKQRAYKKLISKIEFMAPVFEEEYEFAKKKYPHLKYCPFQYFSSGTSDFNFKEVSFEKPYNIFVGNSLDPTNNHLDVLKKLDDMSTAVSAIVPISYSGSLAYKDFLKKECSNLHNVRIRFLENFMPLQEYFKLAASCPFAIYAHRRQQAAGNIGQMLKNGVKVFLYKDSINYKYYTRCGYKVFSIEDDLNEESLKETLSSEYIQQNRNAYMIYENTETYKNSMQKFFDEFH